jgi:glycosyltransferase involved in cell wall biosynthesis
MVPVRPLSIAHVTDAFYPERGGVERVIENLAGCQVKAGHQVVVISKMGNSDSINGERFGAEIRRYQHNRSSTPMNYLTSISGSRKVFDEISTERKIDLVHCHLTLSSQGPIQVARKKNIPVVSSFYGPWDKEFEAETRELGRSRNVVYRAYLRSQMYVQRRLQNKMLDRANRVIVLSDHSVEQARRINRWVEKKIVKVPGGVEADRFFPSNEKSGFREKHGVGENEFLILAVRRLSRRMGLDLLVEAIRIVRDQGKDVRCLIGGTGPQEESLRRLIRELHLEKNVLLTGFIPDAELPDAYRSADLTIMPTREEENFGLPILESLACGTPVIGTAVGSISEVLGSINPNWMIREVSARSIADKMMEMIEENRIKKSYMPVLADKIHKVFGWSAIAGKTESVYEEVLG